MAESIKVDPDALDRIGQELRRAAVELQAHADRFTEQCGGPGDETYGVLAESQRAAEQHQASVGSMHGYLSERIAQLHAQADALASSARAYRNAQRSALEAIADAPRSVRGPVPQLADF
ncbi:hypothetical protein ABZ707_18080 [Streptomyces sp. NPDC006923]|uniref:hypothetical protein n=1 Tax=Streptomyces sp. NPDC006923 TaxID=3155355 RepID=UPI0033EFD9AC